MLSIPRAHLDEYKIVAAQVAEILKEYGAIAYYEYVSDDLVFNDTKSFRQSLDATGDEEIIFGWVVFLS